jgi:hypothetical protein
MATDTGAERRALRAAARREAAKIGTDALLILDALDDHDHGTGEVFVGNPTLARLADCGLDRVRRRLAEMVAAKVLTDTDRKVNNTTVYALPWGADKAPEATVSRGPAVDQPSTSPRVALDQPSTGPQVLSTETRGFGAQEGEGEGKSSSSVDRALVVLTGRSHSLSEDQALGFIDWVQADRAAAGHRIRNIGPWVEGCDTNDLRGHISRYCLELDSERAAAARDAARGR